jgi:mannosyl-glycoprotein endo-beta-N-acetylglucosaminidase
LKSQNKRKVYIGNDCFGRNTYGGGKFDIYKAANKILENKNQLSIALFAPGYTY